MTAILIALAVSSAVLLAMAVYVYGWWRGLMTLVAVWVGGLGGSAIFWGLYFLLLPPHWR